MSDDRDRYACAFESVVDAYERGRPGYAREGVEWIAEKLDLRPGRTVLDLGAGTGKLTRLLVRTGASVVAVEPGDAMRARLERAVPGVEALARTAEAIPLADASVDGVTVAQAFHWFDPETALPEMRRVLRSGGGVALLWNTRDERDPLQRHIDALLAPLRGAVPPRDEHDPRELLPASGLFSSVAHARFEHEQGVDEDAFVERFTSVSFVAAASPEERELVVSELRRLVVDVGRPISIPYVTDVFVAFAR